MPGRRPFSIVPSAVRRGRLAELCVTAALLAIGLAFQLATASLVSPLEPAAEASQGESSALSPARAWAAPVLGTADGSGLQPRVALSRIVVEFSGEGGLVAVAALLAIAFVVVGALGLRACGSRWLPALAAPLAMLSAGVFRNPPAVGVGFALQALLAATVFLLAARHAESSGARPSLLLLVVLALAVSGEPSWLLIAIPAWAVTRPRGAPVRATDPAAAWYPPRGRWFALQLLACAILAVAAVQAVAATAATFARMPVSPGDTRLAPGVREILAVAFWGPHWAWPTWSDLVHTAQRLLGGWLAVYGLVGTVLAVAGAATLLAARPRAERAFILGWLGASCLLVLPRAAEDAAPAILLVMLGGALLVALGGTWLIDCAGRRGALAAATVIVALPAMLHLVAVAAAPRWLDGPAGAAYARAIADAAGPRTAFVADSIPVDRLVLRVARSARSAEIRRLPPDAAVVEQFRLSGYRVFAFARSRAELAAKGERFTERPLVHRTLGDYLDTLPEGTVAAIAASGGIGEAVRHSPMPFAARLGGTRRTRESARLALCLLGRVGARAGAMEQVSAPAAAIVLPAGEAVGRIGGLAPATLSLAADDREAVVRVAHRGTVRAEEGVALVVIDAAGDLLDKVAVDAGTGFQVRVARARLSLGAADGLDACVGLSPGQPLDVSRLAAAGAVGWSVDAGRSPRPAGTLHLSMANGSRFAVPLGARPPWGRVRLGLLSAGVTARTTSDAPPLRLCGASAQERLLFETEGQQVSEVDFGSDDPTFGAGWFLPENDDGMPFRWTSNEPHLLVRLRAPGDIRLVVVGSPASENPPPEIALDVNGTFVGSRTMVPGIERYEWMVPAGAWRAGLNIVALRLSRTAQGTTDERVRGAALRTIRFERVGASAR